MWRSGSYAPDASIESYRHLLATLGGGGAVAAQRLWRGQPGDAGGLAPRPGFRGVAVVAPTIPERDVEALHRAGIRGGG
jgi:hypothetical protein